MLKLNLLPPQEKKVIELTKTADLLLFLLIRLVFFLIIFVLLLAGAWYNLRILNNAQLDLIQTRQSEQKNQDLAQIEDEITRANQKLGQINAKQKDLILWTPILEELSRVVSGGIYLMNISYQQTDGKIRISGWARTREALLSFQDALQASSYFVELESPLANLIKQTDINFNLIVKPSAF